MKKILIFIFFFASIFGAYGEVLQQRVTDHANVLTQSVIMHLNNRLSDVRQTVEIGVLIVKTTDGNIEQYANTTFKETGLGDKTKNNGVLILISVDEKKIRFEIGYGLEGAIPDSKSNEIATRMAPLLKVGKYQEAIEGAINEVHALARNEQFIEKVTSPVILLLIAVGLVMLILLSVLIFGVEATFYILYIILMFPVKIFIGGGDSGGGGSTSSFDG